MLPATFKLCAAISYQHLRNMTGEGLGAWGGLGGAPLPELPAVGSAGRARRREEAGVPSAALPTPCPAARWVSCSPISTTHFATSPVSGVRGGRRRAMAECGG